MVDMVFVSRISNAYVRNINVKVLISSTVIVVALGLIPETLA